jgi:hypothetical protein
MGESVSRVQKGTVLYSRDRSLTVMRKVLTAMGESVSNEVQKGPVLYRRDRSLTFTRKVLTDKTWRKVSP